MKLTEWFPADVKPVRPGFYQRKWGDKGCDEMLDIWTGSEWRLGGLGGRDLGRAYLEMEWRGLAEQPK